MIASLLDWFVKFPALWAATGFIVGGIAVGISSVLVFRRYGDAVTKSADKLVGLQTKQLEVMERTLVRQKDHYEAELEGAKDEWKACRKELHTKREEWNAESLRMQLLIADLEGRPNVTTLNETMKEVCVQLSAVAVDLREHEQQTEQRFREFMNNKQK